MNDPRREALQIKKYPNRRYYDATRSCHVTLKELHDLIQEGRDVCVTDSRSGDDITNAVLMQVLMEKDHPKIDFFPSAILHFMIRSNPQSLRNYSDQVFGPFFKMMAGSGKQFDEFVRGFSGGGLGSDPPNSPLDWAKMMMGPFARSPSSSSASSAAKPHGPTHDSHDTHAGDHEAQTVDSETLTELRSQLADLTRRIEGLTDNPSK